MKKKTQRINSYEKKYVIAISNIMLGLTTAEHNRELVTVINKIYEEGFEDGFEDGSTNIDNASVCELAHTLTVRECKQRAIKHTIDIDFGMETKYTSKAQKIFNYHYDTITNTLNL